MNRTPSFDLAYLDKVIAEYRLPFLRELAMNDCRVIAFQTSTFTIITLEKDEFVFRRFGICSFYFRMIRYLSRPRTNILTGDLGLNTLLSLAVRSFSNGHVIAWCRLTIWTERNVGLARRLIRQIICPRLDQVIVNGDSGKEYIKSLGATKIEVFHQSSVSRKDFENLKNRGTTQGPLKLIFVGRLIPLKGLKEFLSVLQQKRSQFEVTIVGDGSSRTELEYISNHFNLNILFLGHKSRLEILNLLNLHNVLLMPSLGDEWGLVVIEGMSQGLPILGSIRAGAIEELAQLQYIGPTFDPMNSASITNALNELLTLSRQELKMIGDKNRKLISDENITQEGMAVNVLNILKGFESGDN
jgi:glycosyltransferase involved in cell wall biosynthesis